MARSWAGWLGTAAGSISSVQGGYSNRASSAYASVAGGCDNLAGPGSLSTATCEGGDGSDEAILGGHQISLATTYGTYPAGP
jgi:hypothetical protein